MVVRNLGVDAGRRMRVATVVNVLGTDERVQREARALDGTEAFERDFRENVQGENQWFCLAVSHSLTLSCNYKALTHHEQIQNETRVRAFPSGWQGRGCRPGVKRERCEVLGYRFSPRIADIGGARYWRICPSADYGPLNDIAAHRINAKLIAEHWNDLLRLAGSLKLGVVQATSIMRTLQIGDRPTRLAQAVAELGRIDKTIHALTYIEMKPNVVVYSSN